MPIEKNLRKATKVMATLRCAPDLSTSRMVKVIAARLSEAELDDFEYVLHLAGHGSRTEVAAAHDKRRALQAERTD